LALLAGTISSLPLQQARCLVHQHLCSLEISLSHANGVAELHVLFDQAAYGPLHVAPANKQICGHLFELPHIGAFINCLLIDGK
jgi:hypothetical protein